MLPKLIFKMKKKKTRNNPLLSDPAVRAELAVLILCFLPLLKFASQWSERVGSVKPCRVGLACAKGKGVDDL